MADKQYTAQVNFEDVPVLYFIRETPPKGLRKTLAVVNKTDTTVTCVVFAAADSEDEVEDEVVGEVVVRQLDELQALALHLPTVEFSNHPNDDFMNVTTL